MVTGSTQSAWIKNMPIGSTIYFKLLNFDPTATFSYVITITEANTAD